MLISPPGRARCWTEMLSEPWNSNPEVVVVMVPVEGASIVTRAQSDGSMVFSCIEYKGDHFGLQILKPQCDTLRAQQLSFNSLGADMMTHAFQGRLADVPQKLLLSDDFLPLIMQAEKMGADILNLRVYCNMGFNIEGQH